MEKTKIRIPSLAYSILSKHERSQEEIEHLISFLKTLDDLNNYTEKLPKSTLVQLAKNFTVEEFFPGETIFVKG